MPYRYIAFDGEGNEKRGVLHVEEEEAAERILLQRALTVAKLTYTSPGLDLAKWFPTFFGPKRRDVIIFSSQLANLIESGVPVLPAMELMAGEISSQSLRKVLREIVEDIRQGNSISLAMAKHDDVFPPFYHRMIRVGEQTGNLDQVLRQLATHMEKEEKVKKDIRGAMTYPAVILLLAFGVVMILLNFSLPPLLQLYNEFEAELPWPTRFLMGVSSFFLQYRLYLLLGLIILVGIIILYVRFPRGKRQLHRLLLKAPVLGKINTFGNVVRFSRTLATLLRAGLQITESMELTRQTLQNVILKEEIEKLRQETFQGRGISGPLAQSPYFPHMLSQVVRVGEETGTLDTHLETTAAFYEEEVDRSLENLTTLLEPAMIIFVGIIVGFVAISVILPMYSLLGQIR
ncbi:MAG: type II secretion system F family protein [Anaerolineales bacterium]